MTKNESNKKRNWLKWIGIAIAVFAFISIGSCILFIACVPTSTSTTDETDPAIPANTATPVSTPTPAPTATPALLACADIEREKKGKTDLQWEAYTKEIIGEKIRFAGDVVEVYDDGRIQIDDCRGLLTICILYKTPLDVAVTLDKDERVEGIGTVKEVGVFLALYVHINVETIEAR